jgi:hypothetical protein
VNVNAANKDGWTPLHEAAARHYEKVRGPICICPHCEIVQ